MNRTWAALVLAVLLLPATPANAQESEQVLLIRDDSGDVVVSSNGQQIPDGGRFQNLDITSVHAVEHERAITFQVGIASDESILILETGSVALEFAHRNQPYRLVFGSAPWVGLEDFQWPYAELLRYDPTAAAWNFIAFQQSTLENNAYTVDVPRDLLIDESGTAPFPGRQLTNFHATAAGRAGIHLNSNEPVVEFVSAHDEAEADDAVLDITKGFAQIGHVRLFSDEPTRASNGEATSFVYEVKARSLDGADDVVIEFANVPTGWEATASRDVVSLDGEGFEEFLVRVDIPFAHQHGVTERLMVEARSIRDSEAVGRMELGVHYLEIPQLSGHHNTLYVHSGDWGGPMGLSEFDATLYGRGQPIGYPFMNSLQEFAGNSGSAMASDNLCSVCLGGDQLEYTWSIPLAPSLRMGIDLNMSQVGDFKFSFSTGRPMPEATASGQLIYKEPEENRQFSFGAVEGQPIAELATVSLGDLAALSTAEYQGTVTPLDAGDYIEYERGAQVYLVLRLTSSLPPVANGHDNPLLNQGGWMQLPLNEYADTVADLSGFALSTPDEAVLDSFDDDAPESKSTPMPSIALLAAAALLRRRR